MAGMRFGETRLLIEGLDAHLSHEPSYMDSAYSIASQSEHVSHTPGAEIRFFKMNLVDYAHEFPVVIVYRGRYIIRGLTGKVVRDDTASLTAIDFSYQSSLCARPVYAPEHD